MPDKTDLKKKVEETLNSLNGIQRANLSPFFFTRVQAALAQSNNNTWNRVTAFVTRPAVVAGGVLIIILFNALALWQHGDADAPAVSQNKQRTMADDYSLATITVYDYENAEAR